MIFVTGGAGFIGSNFIRTWIAQEDEPILNIDKLTYAGHIENLEEISNNKNYFFSQTDIKNSSDMKMLFEKYKPRAILNFAAESHVDQSIQNPREFLLTNILGTFELLQVTLEYWKKLNFSQMQSFRFIQISTDEVYGSLSSEETSFHENTRYAPNNPYSATKASGDHLVRAYQHTYGLPTVITNCTNNFGPYQFPEKLVPLVIHKAIHDQHIPIFGDGLNIRDWLFVDDHTQALLTIMRTASANSQYCIGARNERTNLEVIDSICTTLDQIRPRKDGKSYLEQKRFTTDRPGHDRKYSINPQKLEKQLGWKPKHDFANALNLTVNWYLRNQSWVQSVLSKVNS